MEIIDNINRLLGDDLKKTLKPGTRLKVAASCFSMYAYEASKTELEKINELNFIFTASVEFRVGTDHGVNTARAPNEEWR